MGLVGRAVFVVLLAPTGGAVNAYVIVGGGLVGAGAAAVALLRRRRTRWIA